MDSSADDDALTAGRCGNGVIIIRAARRGIVRVPAAGTAAVELDALALASDTVALAGAACLGVGCAVVAEGAGRAG